MNRAARSRARWTPQITERRRFETNLGWRFDYSSTHEYSTFLRRVASKLRAWPATIANRSDHVPSHVDDDDLVRRRCKSGPTELTARRPGRGCVGVSRRFAAAVAPRPEEHRKPRSGPADPDPGPDLCLPRTEPSSAGQ